MSITNVSYVDLASQIRKNPDLKTKLEIYKQARSKTVQFSCYPHPANVNEVKDIDIIKAEGLNALMDTYFQPKPLCKRVLNILSFLDFKTSITSLAVGGGIYALNRFYPLKVPFWVIGACTLAAFVAQKSILSNWFKRKTKGFVCALSKEEIPHGQLIRIGNENFDINHFVFGMLEFKKPKNPLNQQDLEESDLDEICKYYQIGKKYFKKIFNISLKPSEETSPSMRKRLDTVDDFLSSDFVKSSNSKEQKQKKDSITDKIKLFFCLLQKSTASHTREFLKRYKSVITTFHKLMKEKKIIS